MLLRSPKMALTAAVVAAALVAVFVLPLRRPAKSEPGPAGPPPRRYQPRKEIFYDTSGLLLVFSIMPRWDHTTSLEQLRTIWAHPGLDLIAALDRRDRGGYPDPLVKIDALMMRTMALLFEGQATQAYRTLAEARSTIEENPGTEEEWLYSVVYLQGLAALRQGEDENCVFCRGESACILPISSAAVHTLPDGSRRAVRHFTEYLTQFPDDLGARWLLNLAHMTLGEYPDGVDPRFLVPIEKYLTSEFDIGRFRDVWDEVGVRRLNEAGGAIMDDFDGDGLLDIVITTQDPTMNMAFYRNRGDGTFEDRTRAAGLQGQYGGLNCCQADYNNDGRLDIYICRGAWLPAPMRASLLRNNGNGTFTDVTAEAGLLLPQNSIAAQWADFDNDGLLDLFVCCETGPNRLFRNKGDGTFAEVAEQAGLAGTPNTVCKGVAWLDFDNDGYPDIFLNYLKGKTRLFRNNRNGTFTDVSADMGIDGPVSGFSCWAWDYDNDGYLDLFATSYAGPLAAAVKSLQGLPHDQPTSRLYRNLAGKGFKDVTREAGLDGVYVTMGSNFGDFDNDGYLDFYLGTGSPNLDMLVPNRMFKNVGGKRFAEITASSRTGHLQKGHSVAIGDWDRNGTPDMFVEAGGSIPGDRYHNLLFQNPGQGNNWLNVRLIGAQTPGGGGKKSNRSALGARIKLVTAGPHPLTVYRHVSSGSSFGANPLEQMLGLGKAERVASLEVHWPTSGTTQTFRDLAANQAIEITELAPGYRKREYRPLRPAGAGSRSRRP